MEKKKFAIPFLFKLNLMVQVHQAVETGYRNEDLQVR